MTNPPSITVHTDRGPWQLPAGSTVAHLLSQWPTADQEAVATAVNGEFVARSERAQHVLHDGDTLLCFTAITGG
ncbi:MAG: sulfur carrier protein ThiS [Rubrivivax sp.]|nr:MAG: sulfur carrier protein ThiS [Rubrivivax sp.]